MTEDDAHGGLEAVLARALEEYGLQPEAGLTGLLRHLQGNRVLNDHLLGEHIILLQSRISAFMDAVRKMKEDGTIVDLFMVAEMVDGFSQGEGPLVAEPRRTINDTTLGSFVTGVKESFPQYDQDHRHVPKPEQKEDHDEGR